LFTPYIIFSALLLYGSDKRAGPITRFVAVSNREEIYTKQWNSELVAVVFTEPAPFAPRSQFPPTSKLPTRRCGDGAGGRTRSGLVSLPPPPPLLRAYPLQFSRAVPSTAPALYFCCAGGLFTVLEISLLPQFLHLVAPRCVSVLRDPSWPLNRHWRPVTVICVHLDLVVGEVMSETKIVWTVLALQPKISHLGTGPSSASFGSERFEKRVWAVFVLLICYYVSILMFFN
jgi:hypothetical protein